MDKLCPAKDPLNQEIRKEADESDERGADCARMPPQGVPALHSAPRPRNRAAVRPYRRRIVHDSTTVKG